MIAKACLRQGSFAPGNRGIVDHRGEIRQRSAAVTFARRACRAIRRLEHPLTPRQFKRAIDMTDDELAAIASGATLHVVK